MIQLNKGNFTLKEASSLLTYPQHGVIQPTLNHQRRYFRQHPSHMYSSISAPWKGGSASGSESLDATLHLQDPGQELKTLLSLSQLGRIEKILLALVSSGTAFGRFLIDKLTISYEYFVSFTTVR